MANTQKNIVDLNSSEDCELIDAHISTITIPDSSFELSQYSELDEQNDDNNQDIVIDSQADSAIDIATNYSGTPIKTTTNIPLLRISFKNAEAFNELHGVVSACIRDTLFARKKAIEISIIQKEFTVCFNQLDSGVDDGLNDSIFMIDTLPMENENVNEVPDYKASIDTVLANGTPSPEPENERLDKPKNICWNCGGGHMLRDCPAPRDVKQINRSKLEFLRGRTERYHVDADQKFSRFLPGTISDDLKNALGLHRDEIPLHVYRMRLVGYPPGWLEDAKVAPSGMSLFVSETKQINTPDMEEGEVEPKEVYDPKRFISYPGFNAPFPDNCLDESHYINQPEMQEHQSLDNMIYQMRDNLCKSYKRKKLKHVIDEKKITNSTDDMDIAHSDGEITDESRTVFNTTTEAASMTELEQQKEDLLKQLSENGDTEEQQPDLLNVSIAPIEADSSQEDGSIANNSSGTSPACSDNNDNCCTPRMEPGTKVSRLSGSTTPNSAIKEVVMGTPLLKSSSPYTALPDGQKWAAGVCDVIDFENLPDATGTYEKLSGLIKKVRTVVNEINAANDAEDDD